MEYFLKESRLFNSIKHLTVLANEKYSLWKDNELILIGLSGGKDSLSLVEILASLNLQLHLIHVKMNIDMPIPEINRDIPYTVVDVSGHNREFMKKKNPCFSCTRLRRRKILEFADERGIKKIAFAHHKNDVIETLLLNMFYGREISTMKPRQVLFNGLFEIIRPFYLVPEKLINKLAKELKLSIVSNLCEFDNQTKRALIKKLITQIEQESKKIDLTDNIYSSMFNIKADFLPGESTPGKQF